jgi:RNA polymerase sigma factor (sigma-70 family)
LSYYEYLRGMATAMAIGLIAPAPIAQSRGDDTADDDPVPESQSPEELSTEEQLAQMQLIMHMKEALAGLPDRQRTLIERVMLQEVPLLEAAKEVGLSESWAWRLQAQALEALGKALRARLR